MFLGLAQGSGGGVRGLGGCWVGVPQGLGQRISGLLLPPIPPPSPSWGQTLGHAGYTLAGNGDRAAGSPLGVSGDGCAHQWSFVLLLLLRSGARLGVSAAVLRLGEAEPPPFLPSVTQAGVPQS